MKATDAVEYFGSRRKLCEATGASRQRCFNWLTRDGNKIPPLVALKLQTMTRGRLKVDLSVYE